MREWKRNKGVFRFGKELVNHIGHYRSWVHGTHPERFIGTGWRKMGYEDAGMLPDPEYIRYFSESL